MISLERCTNSAVLCIEVSNSLLLRLHLDKNERRINSYLEEINKKLSRSGLGMKLSSARLEHNIRKTAGKLNSH
jgi:hypothetical protein